MISDKKMKECRDYVIKQGHNSISGLQIRFGMGYTNAHKIYKILEKDSEVKEATTKYQKEKPKKVKTFVKEIIEEIKNTNKKDYINFDEISERLGLGYDIGREVRVYLQNKKYISDDRVYLIKKSFE